MPFKVAKALNVEYDGREEIWLTNQRTLRSLVGILGMLLPLLLYLILFVDSGHADPLDSISHYYYTRANSVFIITVSLMAIFLLIYKGEEPVDFYLSSVAGICALLLVMFPTSNITEVRKDPEKIYCVTILQASPGREIFHYIAAGIFLSALAVMSIWVFTRPGPVKTVGKRQRNRIYKVCGVLMVVALLIILQSRWSLIIPAEIYDRNHLTFWMESAAVILFGISWMVKGKFFGVYRPTNLN